MYIDNEGWQVTRHICPRNCYDTCGILAYVKNGRLVKVTGDPKHGHTKGKLCAKGYSYVRSVYSPDRIKYPMRQTPRGSGQWQRISWDEAMGLICEKILEIKDRYGSTLPLCLNKYSGNFGVLHYAAEGFFNSLGPTTQVVGSPCWSAGLDAQYYDMGNNFGSDPEEIAKAKLIFLWGTNPVWTSVHSMSYIYKAQAAGAKVVVIDPVYTQTARKADLYIQVKPGGDGALALAIAKLLMESGNLQQGFLEKHTLGWEQFAEYLRGLDMQVLTEQCGQKAGLISELANLFTNDSPAFIWVGFGMQRHTNGGQNVRAIDALAAMTGNIGRSGGGVHFANLSAWRLLEYNFLQTKHQNRCFNINKFATQLKGTKDPPVKLLWVACRNLIRQDADIGILLKVLQDIDLVVAVDMFITDTVRCADLVLPTTSLFESLDVVPSYWHHWLGISERAISPYYESKSDLEIVQMAAGRLNKLRPGSCSFPAKIAPEDILDKEFGQSAYELLGVDHWTDLLEEPVRINFPVIAWADHKFTTPSGKYEFYSKKADSMGVPPLPVLYPGRQPEGNYPYWLLTPHTQHSLNSQFQNLDWMAEVSDEPVVYVNPETASARGIKPDDLVRIYNECGEMVIKACTSKDTPPDILVCYPGRKPEVEKNPNILIMGIASDMGESTTGAPGMAFYDVFVNFEVL